MSGDLLYRLKRESPERLEVVETERGAVVPGTGLILEWARERRCEESSFLTDVMPDHGFDVPTSERGRRSFGRMIGHHGDSSLCDLTNQVALEEESTTQLYGGSTNQVPKQADQRERSW